MCFGTSGTDKEEIWAGLSDHAAVQRTGRADGGSEHASGQGALQKADAGI